MFKKVLLVAGIVLALAGCQDDFDSSATTQAHQARQAHFATQAECQKDFNQRPDACYLGQDNLWYSPVYYPWGAVVYPDGQTYYNQTIYDYLLWRAVFTPSYATNVNYTYATPYITRSASTMRAASYSSTSSYSSGSSVSRGGFGSTGSGFSGGG
jgi:uncharacterized membrane protein YgcG